MILDPGDIQLLANTHVFHARTAYKDYPPGSVDERGRPRVRRHLMRLWLSVPEGGITVDLANEHEADLFLQMREDSSFHSTIPRRKSEVVFK